VNDFLGALAATREAFRQEEYIHRVKSLIREKIYELDKEAVVEDTLYFNHSAIPDFVVTWSGQKTGRDFYLRGSYASIIAADDVGSTASLDPVYLSLDANKDFQAESPPISPAMIAAEPQKSGYTLLTDVRAMNEILQPTAPSEVTPLSTLVKSSFIRGGRGLIDEDRAESLVTTTTDKGSDKPDLLKVVRESFSESAATKMERTAAIIDLALDTEGHEKKSSLSLELLSGRLSGTELHAILPWLLSQDRITQDLGFWKRIADMTSLRDIESISRELEGLNLDLLVKASATSWKAKRTYLGVSRKIETEERDGAEGHQQNSSLGWSFQSGNLSLDNGTHRVLFSSDGRSLPGRDETRIPEWRELKEQLADFRLAAVNLRGITRSVRIDAEQSDDIRQDVEDVAISLDDSYSVSEVALKFAPRETRSGTAAVNIRFGKGLATTEGGATLADLTRASLQVMAYKAPVAADEVDRWLEVEPMDAAPVSEGVDSAEE
jgi:hypothetical protein